MAAHGPPQTPAPERVRSTLLPERLRTQAPPRAHARQPAALLLALAGREGELISRCGGPGLAFFDRVERL